MAQEFSQTFVFFTLLASRSTMEEYFDTWGLCSNRTQHCHLTKECQNGDRSYSTPRPSLNAEGLQTNHYNNIPEGLGAFRFFFKIIEKLVGACLLTILPFCPTRLGRDFTVVEAPTAPAAFISCPEKVRRGPYIASAQKLTLRLAIHTAVVVVAAGAGKTCLQ